MDNFLDMGLGNYFVLKDITNKKPTNQISNGLWKIFFDGACSKNRLGIGEIFEILNSKINPHAFKLQFECTNNEAEYEALVQGLELAKNMGINFLFVFRYLELVINQTMNKYGINKCILVAYAKNFWDLIENFQAFNTTFIHS